MAKPRSRFTCQTCGSSSPKWEGKCSGCGEWNTMVEELAPAEPAGRHGGPSLAFGRLDDESPAVPRIPSGIGELDRVLGGGIVPGSAILVGGDPGIGKSTLLLQAASRLAGMGVDVVYASGEESLEQIRLRARRLGLSASPVRLASTNDAWACAQAIRDMKRPGVAIIDSIQTMSMAGLDSAPGTVSQIRASAHELIRAAKDRSVALFLVGHVTKEGVIAGPKVLEHAVDTVAYFSGDASHQYRMIRAVKNRFGATDEIGVFAMTDAGLSEVANPSEIFLSERRGDVAGSVVFAGLEGTRPLLVEVQALAAPAAYGTPRRTVVGWDNARLATLLAVLEARCGVGFSDADVYLNVVGGFRISEPAADLAVAAALLSARTGKPLPADLVAFGEVGLGGEIRPVSQAEGRLKEAVKLGFAKAFLPKRKKGARWEGMETAESDRLIDLVNWVQSLE